MESESMEDLGWLAFRYISNEMTAQEREAFELRLAEDQAAREAVAQAVAWTEVVARGESEVIPVRRRVSLRSIRWIAAAAASIAAGVLLWNSARTLELKSLARALAEHMGPGTFSVSESGLLADSDDLQIDDESDLTVPSWMIDAVVGSADTEKWEDI